MTVLILLGAFFLVLHLLIRAEERMEQRKLARGGPSPSSHPEQDNFSEDHANRPRLGLKRED